MNVFARLLDVNDGVARYRWEGTDDASDTGVVAVSQDDWSVESHSPGARLHPDGVPRGAIPIFLKARRLRAESGEWPATVLHITH
jgi:hypothetical protein